MLKFWPFNAKRKAEEADKERLRKAEAAGRDAGYRTEFTRSTPTYSRNDSDAINALLLTEIVASTWDNSNDSYTGCSSDSSSSYDSGSSDYGSSCSSD